MWSTIVNDVVKKEYKSWEGDYDYWYGSGPQTIQVVEAEERSKDIGILDSSGNKIFKKIKLDKMGYI